MTPDDALADFARSFRTMSPVERQAIAKVAVVTRDKVSGFYAELWNALALVAACL